MTQTHPALLKMLERYDVDLSQGSFDALREILQEIILLGLYESGFFKHAVFYGGTALRILHRLPRFSEDLDFSLIKVDKDFDLASYEDVIIQTLRSFGFEVSIEIKDKNIKNNISSAFVKGNTLQHLININAPKSITDKLHKEQLVKIKLEIDTVPPLDFSSENIVLLTPRPFSIQVMTLSSLFAGKMHAILCRSWSSRPKGRDWYDLVWYVANGVKIDLKHLNARLTQSCKWADDNNIDIPENMTIKSLKQLLYKRVENLDVQKAKNDVRPFIKESKELDLWSKEFFIQIIDKVEN